MGDNTAIIALACSECKRRNYTTKKNKRNHPDKLEFKKYCKWCRNHTLHKETKWSSLLSRVGSTVGS